MPFSGGLLVVRRRIGQDLDRLDVFGAWTFGAAALLELDSLAFAQLFDRGSIESRMVEEQLTTLSLNEPETLVHDQLLDRTLRHVRHSSQKSKNEKT
jgi:hypothetical protein